ncbi:MAG: alpha/beta hydrolase [Sphingomonadales bacterium]|nr:MAG: alpha/beta hydrolase [Sphingomonadales bacterium]
MIARLMALLLPLILLAQPATAKGFASDRISVTVVGSGADVVLIPGLSSSPDVWKATVDAVPGYRYHLVKIAGFDGAPVGANASGPVLIPVAGEIARYIREAGLKAPAIVGHSMGGSLALLVAGRNPGLASKVMVVDMLPFLGAMFGGTTPESVVPIASQVRTGIATSTGAARKTQIETTIASMIRTESMRPSAIAQSLASDPVVSGQGMYDLMVTDLRPEIAKIKVPLTVLWVVAQGAPITTTQMADYYKASYAGAPQAVLKHIPDAGHFIMYDQPKAFRSELRAFLAG